MLRPRDDLLRPARCDDSTPWAREAVGRAVLEEPSPSFATLGRGRSELRPTSPSDSAIHIRRARYRASEPGSRRAPRSLTTLQGMNERTAGACVTWLPSPDYIGMARR